MAHSARQGIEDRRLQARKTPDQPLVMEERSRESESRRVAAVSRSLDLRARRDIPGRAGWPPCRRLRPPRHPSCRQATRTERALAKVKAGMPSGNDQARAGVNVAIGIGELARVKMTFQVIDGDERDLECQRQRLRRRQSRRQGHRPARAGSPPPPPRDRASETPAVRRASSIIGRTWRTCSRDAISGTTPPIALVQRDLRGDDAGADPRHPGARRPRALQYGGGRLVARRLDGQKDQAVSVV